MADWFKFFNNGLDEPRLQYAISEQPLVTSAWLLILSEASKKRSAKITWRDEDFELFGFARKINVSPPILNQCLQLLVKIGYITMGDGFIEVPGWNDRQSDYAKGLEKGYYKKTSKRLASDSEVSRTRGEERRVEGGGLNSPRKLRDVERIGYEKERERIAVELKGLGKLNDHAKESTGYLRVKALKNRDAELKGVLGVIA